ncbi:carbohydrate ABC transporter permease [Cohnella boryungensis]|uniref:Carbohydrate ABC transporter permease n=1 Tax=Cohnella boryungensis TaxID=768479 RepID=A0ABV8SA17_9BACL
MHNYRVSLFQSIYRYKHAYLFLLPLIVLLGVFSYYPIVMALKMSFYQWKGGNEAIFIGFDNFVALFKDKTFYTSLKNALWFILFDCTVGVLMPLFIAELLFHLKSARLQYVFRTLFVATITVPSVIIILVWVFLYNPVVGGMNTLVSLFGVSPQLWLGGTDTALFSVIFSGFPFINPIFLLIVFAALQSIPKSLIEASVMEGCGPWRRILSIDIPMIMGQLKLIFILGILHGMQSFYKQLIMTNGGPGEETLVPGLYMFQSGFSHNDFGYASTIGFVMLILMLALTIVSNKLIKSGND